MKRYDYNLIVIGAGSAGLVASYIAAAFQAKVALIERDKMGGDCLNTGCVPSKTFIRASREGKGADFGKVMQEVHGAIAAIAPHDSVERYESLGVECISGEARITGPHEVTVGSQVLMARTIIVATGASPFIPPIKGIEEEEILTSENVWQLERLPKKLAVLGGGPIGVELAQAFARLGSEVTIVEQQSRLLGREAPEAAALVEKTLRYEGVNVMTGHHASAFEDGVMHCISAKGEHVKVAYDRVLVALGRRANVKGFGLEALGIKLTEQGTIRRDAFLRTSVPSIYVCGDVTGPYQFTHFAGHQGWQAAFNALFKPFWGFKPDEMNIPRVTYCTPEVAQLGLTREEATEKDVAFEETYYPYSSLDRAIAEGKTDGFIRILTKPGKDRILGVTIAGAQAGEMLALFGLAMHHGMGLKSLAAPVYAYPGWAEACRNAANLWRKNHSPGWVMPALRGFQRFRRGDF